MCTGLEAALLGGGVVGASHQSTIEERKAAKKGQEKYNAAIERATKRILQGQQESTQAFTAAEGRATEQIAPFREAGLEATRSLQAAFGLPGGSEFNPLESASFQHSRGLMDESLTNTLAAKGITGPAAGRIFGRGYSQLAAGETQSQISNLTNLANLGFTGASNIANINRATGANIGAGATSAAANIANLFGSQGQAQAQTQQQLGQTNAAPFTNLANLGLNLFKNYATSQGLSG